MNAKVRLRMKNMERDLRDSYDVVVVGSGPAGASAAKALDQSGLKVVILEKCSLPRDKMCCGMVLPSARKFVSDNFGHIPDNVMCEPWEVRGIRMFITNDSQWVEVPILALDTGEDLPECAFNVYRSGFDLWLCNMSDASLADNSLFVDYRMAGLSFSRHCLSPLTSMFLAIIEDKGQKITYSTCRCIAQFLTRL